MRVSLVSGLVCVTILASCASAIVTPDNNTNHAPVCQQQSDWARSGKVPTGDIAISCPDHGIGDYR